MPSFFDRLRAGLAKTAQQIRERLTDSEPAASAGTAAAPRTAPPETLEAVSDALIGADVGLQATEQILAAAKQERDGSPRERVERVMLRIFESVAPAFARTTSTPARSAQIAICSTAAARKVSAAAMITDLPSD